MMKPASVWRVLAQRYRHEAAQCTSCDKILFPPRRVCPHCRGTAFRKVRLCDRGRIITYTIQHVSAPAFADQTPFAVGIIETDDGVRLMAQIVDFPPEKLRTGERVRLAFRRIQADGDSGVIAYGHKAVPE